MTSGDLAQLVSAIVVFATIGFTVMVIAGIGRLARRPGVLQEGAADLAGATRIARVDRWTVGMTGFLAAIALFTIFSVGDRAALFVSLYIIGVVGVAYGLIVTTETGRRLLSAVPQTWLIGAQTFRVVGGVFLIAATYDAVPAYFAVPAGWGDVITGLTAPLAALAWAKGASFARRAAWTWNVFGLLDLTIAVGIGSSLLAVPSAAIFGGSPAWLERAALGVQLTAPPIFPVATLLTLIPLYLVPISVLLHLLSLRKLATEREGVDPLAVAAYRT